MTLAFGLHALGPTRHAMEPAAKTVDQIHPAGGRKLELFQDGPKDKQGQQKDKDRHYTWDALVHEQTMPVLFLMMPVLFLSFFSFLHSSRLGNGHLARPVW